MPIYNVGPFSINVTRKAALLDTNVLVAAFWPKDDRYDHARVALDLIAQQYQILISLAVVIETWGMLVGSCSCWTCGYDFLAWLSNPGNAVLVTHHTAQFNNIHAAIQAIHIDCVDATICYLADEVSKQCGLKPAIEVVSYDTSDILKCKYAFNLDLELLDLRSL